MYGKLIEGRLLPAPKKLSGDNTTVFNPPAEMYFSAGYKPVTFTASPDDPPAGYTYESGWEETGETIVQTWTLVELPDDIDDAEALSIILGGAE